MISLAVIALMLFVSLPSFAQEWVEYNNRVDSFGVNLPGQPSVKDIKYKIEYGVHMLPGRVYTSEAGGERYSITVVDYTNLQQMEAERVKQCRAAGGEGDQCMDIYMHDMRGAVIFASWNLINNTLQKGGKLTRLAYSRTDLVEGHEIYITNPDQSELIASIYMHENRLYILEGSVPPNSPPPILFFTSMGFLDQEGKRIRYSSPYVNGLPKPARGR
jgi:hypothetical protein